MSLGQLVFEHFDKSVRRSRLTDILVLLMPGVSFVKLFVRYENSRILESSDLRIR